jgi:DNA-3-methyladenine glycosylase II
VSVHPRANVAGGRLDTQAPFHLEATVRVLQRRPANLVDVWAHDRYVRVFQTGDDLVLVEVENRGTIDAPDVRWRVREGTPSSAAKAALARTIGNILGLDVDPEPLRRLAEAEPRLRPTALALRGMRPPRFPELFEAFANVIPFQQLSLDAGVIIVGRLVERFGATLEHEGRRFHAFPTAGAVARASLSALRACGLSLRKSESLDVGAERGLRTVLRKAERAPLTRIIARFGDYRGYLNFCALGSSLVGKGLIHAAPSA